MEKQLILDIFTTAMEGGIGYWSKCHKYHWCIDRDCNKPDLDGFFSVISSEEGDWEGEKRIDSEVIKRGIRLIKEDKVKAPASLRKTILDIMFKPDEADFDASDADWIVQAGLFGDIVYG